MKWAFQNEVWARGDPDVAWVSYRDCRCLIRIRFLICYSGTVVTLSARSDLFCGVRQWQLDANNCADTNPGLKADRSSVRLGETFFGRETQADAFVRLMAREPHARGLVGF